MKTSRRFMKNKPLFYEKQAVVLWKTSRRFMENKPLFYEKQAVVVVGQSLVFKDLRCHQW